MSPRRDAERHSTDAARRAGGGMWSRIDDVARRRGDAAAWLLPDGRIVSYRALRHMVERYATALRSYDLRRGDRLLVQVEKSAEALLLYLASLRIGAVIVPLNTAYTAAELEYFARDCEPRLIVADPQRAAPLRGIAERLRIAELATLDAAGEGDLPQRVRSLDASLATRDARARADPAAPARAGDAAAAEAGDEQIGADELAAIVYTSGTTGRAKGAMLSHANLSSNAEALVALWRFGPQDVLLHALPIYHVHGLFVATHCALLSGAAMHLVRAFDARGLVALLGRSTAFMGVPTHYVRLLAQPELDRRSTASMRVFISGSAPLLPATFEQFERRTGHRILERYGMSEAGMIASNPYDGARIPGTVGFALPGVELRIVDERGVERPTGSPGVVEVRGPNVFRGYWRDSARTASEVRADGFFSTGDLGMLDHEGRLSLVGRAKDLIISGGLNVYPREIESELDAMPGVIESAVIGVPHSDFGEAVVAVLAMQPGTVLAESDVAAHLGARLARFKQPKRVFFVDDLPRNAMGKVQKNRLRERYADTFER